MNARPAMLSLLGILSAFFVGWLFVESPDLSPYSLQISALLFVVYLGWRWWRTKKFLAFFPDSALMEIALLSLLTSLLLGATGGLESPWIALGYLLLFLTAILGSMASTLLVAVGLTFLLWSTTFISPGLREIATGASFFLLTPVLLALRSQLESGKEEHYQRILESKLLAEQESRVLVFLATHLKPKLNYLSALLATSPENVENARRQIASLQGDIAELASEVDKASDTLDTPSSSHE